MTIQPHQPNQDEILNEFVSLVADLRAGKERHSIGYTGAAIVSLCEWATRNDPDAALSPAEDVGHFQLCSYVRGESPQYITAYGKRLIRGFKLLNELRVARYTNQIMNMVHAALA